MKKRFTIRKIIPNLALLFCTICTTQDSKLWFSITYIVEKCYRFGIFPVILKFFDCTKKRIYQIRFVESNLL